MSERDPFEHLRDLIDQPVEPRERFAAELRSRLMSDLSASDISREEQRASMDGAIDIRPRPVISIERPRRIRPMAILELAAVALVVLGLVAALSRGWFGNDPETPTSVPAAALQGDGTPTPERPEPTATTVPVEQEPTVVPPGNIPGTIWALPGNAGETVDLGGMLVEDGTVYRLLATPSFVGIQAVDGKTGSVKWQQAHRWAGNLFAHEDDTLYFDGGDNTLVAVDAETGSERWRANVAGNPIALADEDDRLFVLLDTDMVTALNEKTGEQLWVAQGTVPQNPTGGSTSIPAIHKIAVEGDTVAAISTYGVLSGFDTATGTERWSHEGYDSATVAIQTEDDRFIVTSGLGMPAMSVRVDDSSDANDTGDCAVYFEPASESGASVTATDATPEAGAIALGVPGGPFHAQAIDPATGATIWEQQAISGAAAATANTANAASPVTCVIDSETGHVAVDASPGHIVAIGDVSSAPATSMNAFEDDDGALVMVGALGGAEQQVMAVAADDGAVFLQLVDGTLVKVDSGQPSDDDHDSSDHDDSGDDTPEAEDD